MIHRGMLRDIPRILDLLKQVSAVHAEGRPDLFKIGTKYSEADLNTILLDDTQPVFVAVNGADSSAQILGYAFCQFKHLTSDGNSHRRSNLVYRRFMRR